MEEKHCDGYKISQKKRRFKIHNWQVAVVSHTHFSLVMAVQKL